MAAPSRFVPGSVDTFRVTGREFEGATRTVHLHYAFDDTHRFTETLTFETPPTDPPAGGPARPGFARALLHLHLAAGTSYFKAALPSRVVVEDATLGATELAFHHHLYDDGLRECAVTNGLDVPVAVELLASGGDPAAPDPAPAGPPGAGGGGLLVPIGGGKDSMVLIEAVRHLRPTLFAVNPHPLVEELAASTGLDLLTVRRTLSPELARVTAAGGRNGHVPVTAIVSLIAVVGSFLYGYDAIAMAVERSASEETVLVDGVPVNHQYSKSLAFERLLADLVTTTVDPGLTYGSALRPYSELAIARTFARLTRYHGTFCSCNTAFRQAAAPGDRWCGQCPKCRFVALALAPFLPADALAAVIGRDLFEDPAQIPGFAALMSSDDKPFECVGERRESAAALRILADLAGWRTKPVVAALADEARALVSDDDVRALLTPGRGTGFPRPDVARAVSELLSGER